ncbi:MAG TPA: T9SS type A sorting domain-containing protein [Ohtaekwangia sp.]|nr:T9SS type A sorting domain-containing protein [Ohtaekwangia sp.]
MRTKKTLRATPVISFYFLIFAILMMSVISSMDGYAQQVARQVPTGYETKFWAYTSPSYSNAGAGHPVLIFLHGGSGIGDDLNILTQQITGSQNNGHLAPSRLIYNLEQNVADAKKWDASLPFVVISPQLKRDLSVPNYNDQQWPAELVDDLIDYVIDQYNIDEQRIYLAGISLGGLGVWNYASEYPHRPAAIVPMSSVTYPETACPVKNVPTWAFHGENDFQVDREFTIDMVEQVNACTGNYTAHLTLLKDRYHEGWNELFTDDNGYRIYDWFLTFQQGDNSNRAPFVFCGKDIKTALRAEPFYIAGDYFDIDGTITNVEWTQTAGPAPLMLDQSNPKILKITNPGQVAGTYTFRLRATDNDSQSAEDFVEITFGNPTGPTITNVWLTDANQANIRVLVEDDVIDLIDLGARKINLRATYANTNSVVWSINTEQTTRVRNTHTNQIAYLGDTSQDWEPESEEEYVVCATPYSATNGNGTQGFSQCFRIRFSNTFYALHNSNISQLTSWNTELDGSGVSPSSFATSGYNYVIPLNRIAIVSSPWQIHEDSKVTVEGGATLRLQNNIQRTGGGPFGNIYAEPTSTIHITANGYQQLAPLSLTSTTIFESPATRMPNTRLGNVILRGTGAKHIQPDRVVTVRGDLTIESASLISGNTEYNSQLILAGDLIIQPGGEYNPQRPLNVTFGSGSSNIVFNGTRMVFHSLSVEHGGTLNIVKENAPTMPTTLEVGANTTAGTTGIFLEEGASLNLNGHTLNLRNGATINPQNQTGEIGLENSTLSIVTTAIGTSNLYPKRGDHALKTLEVNMPVGSTLNIRDSLDIIQNIKSIGGTINSNNLLSLISTPTFTAYLSPRPVGATGSISGNVNFQRSIESGRKYKYLGFPVKNIQVADVQEYIPITGSFPESSTGGGMTANPSFFYYDEPSDPENLEDGWTEYPVNSNTEQLEFGRGYSIFMRESTDHSKLVLTGELQIGDFNYSSVLTPNTDGIEDQGWNLVANPYASTISWNQGWTKTNVSPIVYVRDNRTETSNVWIWDGSTGDEEFGGVIASGQAFWVRTTNASPTLIITEQAKLEQGDASFYRTGSDDVVSLRIQLKQNDRIDNAYLKFSNAGKVKFDDTQDGVKMKNAHFNLSVLSSDLIQTAIKNLCDTLCSQEIGLAVEPKGAGTYSLNTNGNAYDQMISDLYLVDNYVDSVFEWHEGKEYVFQVDENAKSSSQDRFKLIIEKNTMEQPLISWHEGALVSSIGKKVQWMLNGEDIPGATEANFYPTMEGDYTVRLTGKACSKVSPAYSFRITGANNPHLSEVKIYPNPVTNYIRVIGIDRSQAEVAYTITSLSGAVLQRGNVAYEDVSGEGEVKLKSLSTGLYILNVRDTSGAHQFKFSVH